MQTPRLRLYTKNISYARMAQGLLGFHGTETIAKTEALIAQYTGAKHAILTSMGRMAIYEGLRALPKKGEIILSPITVPEVISLVLLAGFRPVFCDTKPGTWNMDAAQIEALITPQTVAVMTTHFYGNTNTTQDVRALCDKHKLLMIEDAAQAIGAWNNGKHAGTVGDFGILSFSYPKNVTSFYGGCLITHDDALAAKVREQVAAYPPADRAWLYKKVVHTAIMDIGTWAPVFQLSSRVIRYGYRRDIAAIKNVVTQELNPVLMPDVPKAYRTRISPAQAKAVFDKWREVDEDAQHRIDCAQAYHEVLRNVPGVTYPVPTGDRSNTYLYFPVQVADKYALQRFMIEDGCDVAIQHAANCADLEAYAACYHDCPAARAAYKGTLMLPTYRGFPLHKAKRYAESIRKFMAQ